MISVSIFIKAIFSTFKTSFKLDIYENQKPDSVIIFSFNYLLYFQ
jgi:hypothetical protein